MNDLSCQTARLQIDALIDGELTPAGAAALQRHLEGCADCTLRVEARRRLVALLSTEAERPLADDRLRQRLLANLPRARRRSSWWLAAPTAVALAASLMLYIAIPARGQLGVEAMMSAHLRSLAPGHLTDVESSDRHTVKPWFNGRLPFSPPVPDLADRQFPLVGGRLDYIGAQSAACLVYRHQLHVINLCLWPRDGTAPTMPKSAEENGYRLLSWQQDKLAVAVISDLNRAELEQFKALWIDRSRDATNSR
jgi:anti-sigma factor RsiW